MINIKPAKKQRGAAFLHKSDIALINRAKNDTKEGVKSSEKIAPNSVDQRNAGSLVDVICSIALRQVVHSEANHASVSKILRSILFPFVARQSKKLVWFESNGEWGELVRSSKHVVAVLDKYCDGEDREQSFVKFHIDSALFRGTGDQTGMKPPRPSWNVDPLFVGWMKSHVRHAVGRKDMSFLYSLQKGIKKAWPKMSSRSLAKAYDTHSELFSTDHGLLPSDLKEEVEMLSQSTFSFLEPKDFTKFIPRGSATVEMSRAKGGCLELFEPFVLPSGSDGEAQGRLRALHSSLETWRVANMLKCKERVDNDIFNEVFPESVELKAIGIFEPGKIRMITKGSGHLYSLLQPLQGAMLGAWKKRKESTMMDPDLSGRIQEIHQQTRGTELTHWASIDYKSATDLIKQDGTFAALKGLVGKPFYEYALVSFGIGEIHYPAVEEENPFSPDFGQEIREASSAWRVDGQPMGHPLSFPLLCLINLAVFRTAIKRWIRSGSLGSVFYRTQLGRLMRRNVLVNGDDMIFKCHPEFYPIFNATAAEAGLQTSPGKQYLSMYFAMINSQIFTTTRHKWQIPIDFGLAEPWNLENPQSLFRVVRRCANESGVVPLAVTVPGFGSMKRVGYLNMNIVDGNTLKKTSEVQATPVAIARDLNSMIALCPWTQCVLPATLDKWRIDWFRQRFQPDWFIKPWLGGFGVDPKYAPAGWKPSRNARFVASCFVHEPKLALYRMKGLGIKLGDYVKESFSYRMIPLINHHVNTELEAMADAEGDKWLAEVMYASRLVAGSQPLESDAVFADRSILKVYKEWKFLRLRPFSDADFERYDSVQFLSNFRAPCPPHGTLSYLKRPEFEGHTGDELTCLHHIQSRIDPKQWKTFRPVGHWLLDRERVLLRRLDQDSREASKVLRYYKSLPSWGGLRDTLVDAIRPPDIIKELGLDRSYEHCGDSIETLQYPIQWVKYDPDKPVVDRGRVAVGPIAKRIVARYRDRPYLEMLDEIRHDCDPQFGSYPGHYRFNSGTLKELEYKALAMGLPTYVKAISAFVLQHRGTGDNLNLPIQGAQTKFGQPQFIRPIWSSSFEPKNIHLSM